MLRYIDKVLHLNKKYLTFYHNDSLPCKRVFITLKTLFHVSTLLKCNNNIGLI